ncbi:undecaprenyl-diphosphate phosphatase [Alkalispirochaeta alkalica]|uniref:undecaprenyl-diphosphate phosphatase n=1 Tax=Alkalispirochaeta alkalica TaxID=46356 RepID=UPI000363121B|nr:undecaprenyl-diphosphate phosphatase [Alkalispirochaeta alkalica]
MNFWQSILLGIVQGISEFIPISSSGHLVVMRAVLGIGEIPLIYDVVLHIATLIVVIVFFRERIMRMIVALLRWCGRRSRPEDARELKLTVLVILATMVTVAIALVIRPLELHNAPRITAGAFLVTATFLAVAHLAKGRVGFDGIGGRHALVVGAVQGLAVIPGISRSGSTITAALYSGISREEAGEFSFLLSIPAILGALVLEMRHLGELGEMVSPLAMAGGFLASLVFGFLSLSLLVRLIQGGKLWVFSFYLVPLGIWGLFALT